MLRQSNILSGVTFILLAAAFGFGATGYRFGSPANMGAGFLPIALSILLAAFGIAIVAQAAMRGSEPVQWGNFWPLLVVVGSIFMFALVLRPLGFAGAAFVTVLVASFAGPRVNWMQRLLPAVILSAVASIVFIRLVGLPIPLWPSVIG